MLLTQLVCLQAILPSVNVRGVHLSVPMPGHLIGEGEEAAVQRDAAALEALVREHDAVFLLLDTREARCGHARLGICDEHRSARVFIT